MARRGVVAVMALALPGCDTGMEAAEPGAPESHADAGPRANVYVPPEGCSGPEEFRMLTWGEGQLQAVRPGCVRVPSEALASLRAACAETPTDPVWVNARRLRPQETRPCR